MTCTIRSVKGGYLLSSSMGDILMDEVFMDIEALLRQVRYDFTGKHDKELDEPRKPFSLHADGKSCC